ncbi:hypothetical protein BABINDRAFT_160042 [Babjeviella inositovora NRRL Y-12698]|uniref:Uncharacterized protein n=1 Tax=Babjeviella inositovora NRRL Y-12698 TaxID=984486 RepID=A0A1E3QXK6_9ASCO|nr:uncharacterized protein BABINDRAFT_160042 [Babjeviella inositovora NRRL Y-12698]ODQ81802.1 hypothetical protein BABINDRAFT_160042 [Babjeviella inositovora NRRL Y-12698]
MSQLVVRLSNSRVYALQDVARSAFFGVWKGLSIFFGCATPCCTDGCSTGIPAYPSLQPVPGGPRGVRQNTQTQFTRYASETLVQLKSREVSGGEHIFVTQTLNGL